MLHPLPQDIFVHILDALDTQYTSETGERSDIWHPGRVSTLRSLTVASRTLCAYARPRLFAHIDFDAGRDAQARAARLLRYFVHEEGDGANSRPNGIRQHRLQYIHSFRLRDGGGPYKVPVPQSRWTRDLATPLGRLLALFLDAPQLQMFAFEGGLWTLAGATELMGYQDYIYTMSSKPSLRVLALTNAYDVPIDVFFKQNRRQSATGIRSLHITNSSFISRVSAQDLERRGSAAPAVLRPIEHLKLGRLNYSHTFDMLQMRRTAMDTPLHSPPLSDPRCPLFYRLKSLCLALSVVPAQMTAMWKLVYGLRDTLEHLQIQNYENISDKLRSSTFQQADTRSLGFGQTLENFSRLDTLTLSTHIVGSSTRWLDSTGNLRWGLPLVADWLGTFIGCPTPNLRKLNLEIFFMGEEGSGKAQTDRTTQNISLEQTAADTVWKTLDSHLTSIMHANPSATISMILHPFFRIKHGNLADAEGSSGSIGCRSKVIGDTFGMDECLPNLFVRAQVDLRVDAVLGDQDMLTYLRSA